jgi:biotin carboxyl carrier protein
VAAEDKATDSVEPVPSGDGPAVLSRLADELLPTLIARLEHSHLGELEVRQDGWRVRLRRAALTGDDAGAAAAGAARRVERRPERASAERPEQAADGRPQPLRTVDEGRLVVAAPAVGYYVPRDGLAVGASLRAGDLVGYVDVLGVRQDVAAPADGLLAGFEVEPGEAVEYGQPVARLEAGRAALPGDTAA